MCVIAFPELLLGGLISTADELSCRTSGVAVGRMFGTRVDELALRSILFDLYVFFSFFFLSIYPISLVVWGRGGLNPIEISQYHVSSLGVWMITMFLYALACLRHLYAFVCMPVFGLL